MIPLCPTCQAVEPAPTTTSSAPAAPATSGAPTTTSSAPAAPAPPPPPTHAPDDVLHATIYAQGVAIPVPAVGENPRFGGGGGVWLGVGTPMQRLRFSVGASVLVGDWSTLQANLWSIEPKARISFNIANVGVASYDLYLQNPYAYFFDVKIWDPGLGAGLVARVWSVPVEAGFDIFFGSKEAAEPGGLRFSLSVGLDVLAQLGVTTRTEPSVHP